MSLDLGFYAKMTTNVWRGAPASLDCCWRTYMWFVTRTTSEIEDETTTGRFLGVVAGGAPVKINEIATDLQRDYSTVRRQVEVLVNEGYIIRDQPGGYKEFRYMVVESYRFNKSEEETRPALDPAVARAKELKKMARAKMAEKRAATKEIEDDFDDYAAPEGTDD